MKKLFLVILATVFMASPASAYDLVSDANTGCVGGTYDISIDGVVYVPGIPAEADGSVKWNVDGLSPGNYIFQAECYAPGNIWGSDLSDPFDATKPTKSGNVRIQK